MAKIKGVYKSGCHYEVAVETNSLKTEIITFPPGLKVRKIGMNKLEINDAWIDIG